MQRGPRVKRRRADHKVPREAEDDGGSQGRVLAVRSQVLKRVGGATVVRAPAAQSVDLTCTLAFRRECGKLLRQRPASDAHIYSATHLCRDASAQAKTDGIKPLRGPLPHNLGQGLLKVRGPRGVKALGRGELDAAAAARDNHDRIPAARVRLLQHVLDVGGL